MPFKIIRNDITKMDVDAIVNAANTSLIPGGGVCGAIFKAAGYGKLMAACCKIGHCDTGGAVITKGFDLPAKYIIHTPGPVYIDGHHNEYERLYSCYKSSLELAKRKRVRSIAFPLISSGIYGYPKAEALKAAANAVMDFLENNDMDVYLVVYDRKSFEISSKLFSDVKEYIDEHLVVPDTRLGSVIKPSDTDEIRSANVFFDMDNTGEIYLPQQPCLAPRAAAPGAPRNDPTTYGPPPGAYMPGIDDMIKNMDASFSERLLELIDESGMTDAQAYKKANVDRKLFSKIRGNRQYKPSKVTAIAFAVALELNMAEARDLVARAGYSLTRSNKFDIIIEYFITRRNYNIFEINEVLFAFDQPLIGV